MSSQRWVSVLSNTYFLITTHVLLLLVPERTSAVLAIQSSSNAGSDQKSLSWLEAGVALELEQ